jgi:hypothetical protein
MSSPNSAAGSEEMGVKKAIICLVFAILSGLGPVFSAGGRESLSEGALTKYFRQKSGLFFERQWGKWGRSKGGLYMPNNLKVHPGGEVCIVSAAGSGGEEDFAYNRAQRFTDQGKFLGWFGGWMNGMQQPEWIARPVSVSFAPDGNIHLLAGLGGTVKTYTPQGEVKGAFSGFGGLGGPTTFPHAVCGEKDGAIYVSISHATNGFINKFDANGALMFSITKDTMGAGNGFLWGPYGLACDRLGNLYACDGGNDRIVKFDPAGALLAELEAAASGPAPSARPEGRFETVVMDNPDETAISPDGVVYVLASHKVVRLDARGKLISVFGGQGVGNNQFRKAVSLSCAPDGRVYVLDADSDARIASVKVLRPAFYNHTYPKLSLIGKVVGMSAAALKLVTVVVEGQDAGKTVFFSTARPASRGQFSFSGFPKGASYRLSLRGTNTFVYREAADITGIAKADVKNLKFVVAAK